MKNIDTNNTAQLAAMEIVTALSGYSIAGADKFIAEIELNAINGRLYKPDHISPLFEKLKGLSQGVIIEAARLARNLIYRHVEVDPGAEDIQTVFRFWQNSARKNGLAFDLIQ